MIYRTRTIVSAAAAALLGAGVLVMGQNAGQNGERPPGTDGNTAQANQANPSNMADQGGMEANRQINADLRQFAQDPKTAADKKFVLDAYLSSSTEIAVSRQALGKTQDNQIKDLANHMIADHQKLNQQLEQVAQQLNVDLPKGTPTMKQAELDLMNSWTGKDYDEQYLGAMDAGHAMAIACFQFAGANAMNPQVKQLAQQSLPTLQHHRDMIQQVAAAIGVNLGGSEAGPAAAHMPGSGTPGTGGPENPTH